MRFFEHLPNPLDALKEFYRLLKPNGMLIIMAPFNSFVYFAPYHYSTGFSRYWYEHHLPEYQFNIAELTPNGDWFLYLKQEVLRLPKMAKQYGDRFWFLAYIIPIIMLFYFSIRGAPKLADDLGCFGFHCIARKR